DPHLRQMIQAHQISLPPLRERQSDIFELIQDLLRELNTELGTNVRGIEPAAVASLLGHTWPGNVAELRLVMELVMTKSPGPRILRKHLPAEFFRSPSRQDLTEDIATLEEVERQHIQKVLELTGGNQTRAARLLGIARSTLINKLKVYDEQPLHAEVGENGLEH
ncbi:MAG: helix-turn-helix domain-containing protein, partial [bacterium]